MAQMRLFNEFGLNRSLAALEPSTKCACHCTFCYVELARRVQAPGKQRRDEDDGSFERLVERSFGPHYDPTDFLQWQLHERVPFVYSTGVEPLQDMAKAEGILRTIDALDLPFHMQTRGLNWREMWPLIRPRADNMTLYVSLPSLNPQYIKAFEPSTPSIDERRALIEQATEDGIYVMVAINPYHPEWCPDLPGMIREVASWGAKHIVLDKLNVRSRQKKSITQFGGDRRLLDLAKTNRIVTKKSISQWEEAEAVCLELGIGIEWIPVEPDIYNIRDVGLPNPIEPYSNATRWPYTVHDFWNPIWDVWEQDEKDTSPIMVTFDDAWSIMEEVNGGKRIDQIFSIASIASLSNIASLPPTWIRSLGAKASVQEIYRALWNNPFKGGAGFPYQHAYARIATKPTGEPWRDEEGNIIATFDPYSVAKDLVVNYDDIDSLRKVELYDLESGVED